MGRVTAAAGVALLLAMGIPTAEAAPYVASCNSGVLAPQLCTFVASSVVAAFAVPGQHLILTQTDSSNTSCGGTGRFERYRGRLRGKAGVREVWLTLNGCPDQYPRVSAETIVTPPTWYDFGVRAEVGPATSPGAPATFQFYEGTEGGTHSRGSAELFRRNTGMSAYAAGISEECSARSPGNGICDGQAGTQREFPFYANVDSSISGHWARLQIAISSQSDDVEDRTVRVTSQPYGNGGWKITRVS